MSSKKSNSDLRRSRSSSSIPVLCRPSKLPTRTSTHKNVAQSSNRLYVGKKSVDQNVKRSSSSSNLYDLKRMSQQSSNSLLRPSGVTPLSQSIKFGKKSPRSSVRKDKRPINDKAWQYEQLVKVRGFVSKEITHLEYNNIKSGISLDTFVELIHSLFQLIDPRINITRENYIEEVPVNLKRYRYSTSVKPSLMKTVNTPYSWPAVLAIFSWLVDFINEINKEEDWTDSMHDIVTKSVIESFNLWNSGVQEDQAKEKALAKLQQNLEKIFDVNKATLENLDTEVNQLEATAKDFEMKNENLSKQIELIQNNINTINHKCENYLKEKDQLESALTRNLVEYSEKVKALDEELSNVLITEESIQNLIALQPHTYTEKLHLSEEIAALKNTQVLKQEKYVHQQELSNMCDYKLAKLKQEIESGAYKYNSINCELELLNAENRCLHIRETGFANLGVAKELEETSESLKRIIKDLKNKSITLQEEINELVKESKQADDEIVLAKSQLEKMSAVEMELVVTMESDEKNYNLEKQDLLDKLELASVNLQKLKDKRIETSIAFHKELEDLQRKLAAMKKFKENFKNNAITFFDNVRFNLHATLNVYQDQIKRMMDEILAMDKREISSKMNWLKRFEEIDNKDQD